MPSGLRKRSVRTKVAAAEPIRVKRGSGNVFADLGLPNPDLALAKDSVIRDLIAERKLTQAKAAELLTSTNRKFRPWSVAVSKATVSTWLFRS